MLSFAYNDNDIPQTYLHDFLFDVPHTTIRRPIFEDL
jgi:hypothetical protein